MADAKQPKRPKVLLAVLLVVLSLGILVGAVYSLGGIGFLTDMIAEYTDPVPDQPIPPRPSTDTTDTAVPVGDGEGLNGEDTAGGDDTSDDSDADADGDSASDSGSSTKPKPAAVTDLSNERAWMYWEQVDSQESITELVEGKWSTFTIGKVTKSSYSADLRITGRYKDGTSLTGSLVLRTNDGKWYFNKITANGNTSPGPDGRRGANVGVIATIVAEQGQASNQALITGMMDGGYKKVTVNSVAKGSGTATIDLTLSGGSKGMRAGRIVCIYKNISGRKYWFITRCEER